LPQLILFVTVHFLISFSGFLFDDTLNFRDMFESLAQVPIQERWREQKYPLAIVAAIIRRQPLPDNDQSACLLICRNSDPYRGKWALVGGKWDFGETLAESIIREVREETGLETTFVALCGLVNERMASPVSTTNCPAHFLIFVCDLLITAGTAQEQAEGAVAWFSAAELTTLHQEGAIIPSDYAMLQRFSGASPVPYSEVELLVSGNDKLELQRFQQIT
jgi:ADP-ribose pyrophosphatase YjhB (NUDIX family)